MNNEEFISRLKENRTEFKDVEELVKYMLPVLQFFIENYASPLEVDNRQVGGNFFVVDWNKISINESYTPESVNAVKVAFKKLQKRIGEFE